MNLPKYKNKYRISSSRAQWWDYATNAAYFITICTKNREHYFGEISDDKMNYSNVGILADVFWHEIIKHANGVELDAFQVMPNHIHGILILTGNENGTNDIPSAETRHALSLPDTIALSLPDTIALSLPDTIALSPPDTIALSLPDTIALSPPEIHPKISGDIFNNANETRHALSLPESMESDGSTNILGINTVVEQKTIGQLRFQNQGKNTISSIVGSYKSVVTRHANRLNLDHGWQPRFHDHIIRNEEEFQRISYYIENNIKNWREDKFH